MGHVLYQLLGWPGGIILGNLMASALWAVPAFAHLHWRLGRVNAERPPPPGKNGGGRSAAARSNNLPR